MMKEVIVLYYFPLVGLSREGKVPGVGGGGAGLG